MSRAGEQYFIIEQKLINLRATGKFSEEEENLILEEMDDLWWKMTEKEMRQADIRARLFADPYVYEGIQEIKALKKEK